MSCGCDGQKNHTPSAAIDHLVKNQLRIRSEMGAGLFLLPDPESGPLQYKKIIVHDLSYVDVQIRGSDCLAYKWIPYAWKDRTELSKIQLFACNDEACSSDSDCEKIKIECWCFRGHCV